MAFLLLSLSALARLTYHAVAKIDGGTNDKGSKSFAICELEGVRHLMDVGDDGGDIDLDGEVGKERVLTGYECLLSEKNGTRLTDQSLRRGCSGVPDSKRWKFRTTKALGMHENWMHSTSA